MIVGKIVDVEKSSIMGKQENAPEHLNSGFTFFWVAF